MNITTESTVTTADFTIHYGGSVSLFIPLTESATQWLAEHCPQGSGHLYSGPNLVVEHRYVDGLIGYAVNDGLIPPASLNPL